MKRNILNIGLVATLLFASSCGKDFLDVNDDPNNPVSAPAELVFPAGVASTAAVVGGDFAILGGIWSQYWTQSNSANQYKDIDAFNLRTTSFQTRWQELYSGALNDYRYVRQQSEADGNGNLGLMATVMQAYTFQVLTDIYDEIPYSEALQGAANVTPAYDPGQAIYDDLIVQINTALPKAGGGTAAIGSNDMVFNGNMSSWIQFANTLKLKIYLRQTGARPSVAEAGVRALYANPNFLDKSASMDVFSNSVGKRNPLFEQDQSPALNTNQNLRASRTMFTYLDANSDPRMDVLYLPPTGAPQKGLEQGGFNTPSTEVAPTSVSRARISPTAPVYFISEAESYFLQAEAVLRGWGTGDAQALYEAGVKASFAQLAAVAPTFNNPKPTAPTQAQATALLAGAYAYPASGSFDDKLEAIITQKWVALAGTYQGIEAFFERNRTGIPKTSSVARTTTTGYVPGQFVFPLDAVTPTGMFARRILTPENELTRNPKAQAALKPITTKVWWAKETL